MLVPVAQHQTRFVIPGISVDARGVAAGRTAVVVLPSLDRVVGALRTLTAQIDLEELYGRLEVHRVRSSLGSIEFALRFPAGDVHLLDRIGQVASLYGGELLTGEGRHFARYRDRQSPLGYDVEQLAETDADLVFYGRIAEGSYRIDETIPLRSLVLRLAPTPDRGKPIDPDPLYLLAVRGLRPYLEPYLWRNHTDADVARVLFDDGAEAYLYRLRGARTRIVDLLARTPGFIVYVPEGEHTAVERGFSHPFDLRACGSALQENSLYLFEGHKAGARVIVGPPQFIPLRESLAPSVSDVPLPARPAAPGPAVEVPLRLTRNPAAGGRADALLIPPRQLGAFRRLAYTLPPEVLAGHRAMSLERGFLIVGDSAIDQIPLGQPLRAFGESTYIPIGHTFLPKLTPELVTEALGGEPGVLYFFVDPDQPPFSVKSSDLRPLSRTLLARFPVRGEEAILPAPDRKLAEIEYQQVGVFPLWGRGYLPPGAGGDS